MLRPLECQIVVVGGGGGGKTVIPLNARIRHSVAASQLTWCERKMKRQLVHIFFLLDFSSIYPFILFTLDARRSSTVFFILHL